MHNILSRAALEIASLRAAAHALQRTPNGDSRRAEALKAVVPEVVARGWPVTCTGDPQTVVGLPIARLAPMLRDAVQGTAGGGGR